METKGQKAKRLKKRLSAKLKAAKSAAKQGVQGAGQRLSDLEHKILSRITKAKAGASTKTVLRM